MELDFDRYCVVDGSPTTVLPSPRNPPKVADRKANCRRPKPSQDFREISFNRYRSTSCRDVRSQGSSHNPELLKRGSEYLSSKEVSLLRNNINAFEISERKKIELSRDKVSEISLEIIDSLCSLDGKSAVVEQSKSSSCKEQIESMSSKSVLTPHTSRDREQTISLHKSLSAKFALHHSPSFSDVSSSKSIGPKMPKKMFFDPSVKRKSRRSPLSSVIRTGPGVETAIANEDIVCKSSTNDVSENPTKISFETSPAHLNGFLRVDNQQGLPSFELSVDSPEEVYVAKTWKLENGPTRAYTFHSPRRRRKNSTRKEFPVLGQMNVSCHLRTEADRVGVLDHRLVTEFVLYDSSKSTSPEDNPSHSQEIKSKIDAQPLPSSEMHPFQELAAIVVEVSLEKRESLKFKASERRTDGSHPSLLELCQREGFSDESSHGTMHVVVPAGSHCWPSRETKGPSPLLERWRKGGGCDCGGWDMACPLNILGNSSFSISEGSTKLMDDRIRAEIFHLGKKDNIPAFAMRCTEEGKYAVSFHAQLSSLQAFSTCIAILHSADTSALMGRGRIKETVESDRLRVFPEEEIIKNLMDALSEEENSKAYNNNNKRKGQGLPQSFVVNPPFSPIARV